MNKATAEIGLSKLFSDFGVSTSLPFLCIVIAKNLLYERTSDNHIELWNWNSKLVSRDQIHYSLSRPLIAY